VALAALANHCLGLSVREVLNALLSLEMEFAPDAFIFRVVERKCVLTEKMHIAEGGGDASITHDNGYLMEAFRQ